MQSGNGVDLGAVYQLLSEVAQTVRQYGGRFDHLERRLDDLEANLGELRMAVTQYHDAVIGHGIELTQLDERIKRIETDLNLEPPSI
jgi:archaellum component FlaC